MQLPVGSTQQSAADIENPFAEPEAPVPKTPEEIEAEIRKRAYNAAITGLMPMKPEDIRNLLQTFDKTRQAVEVPVYPYPEPEIATETISLDPGTKPAQIKVATGHVTTLTLLDVSGEPWPIQDISWAGDFEIVQPEPGGHIIRITPMSEFAYGNISIRLLELKTPVTFVIKTHRDKVQYRFDARIPEYGPNAEPPLIETGINIAAGDSVLNAFLDGVPPAGSERLEVSGADGRTTAYRFSAQTYLRTPMTLLSPGWTSSVSSADGMSVYVMADAPVVLLSDQGKMVRVRLGEKGSDDHDE